MKHIKNWYALAFYCISGLSMHQILSHDVYIIVHGTWAAQESWCNPGGDFFTALEYSAQKQQCMVVSFFWSGKLDNESRLTAGKNLAHLIMSYPPQVKVHIVSHSHGGNVGILACKEIQTHHHIKRTVTCFYALGTPTNMSMYAPPMDIIESFYNLFSFDDWIQPVLGIFGRTYPEHPRIANIRVSINGKGPHHSALHTPVIAQWIPHIHALLSRDGLGNFKQFSFGKPGLISFVDHEIPVYSIDTDRTRLIEQDENIQRMLLANLTRQPAYYQHPIHHHSP